MNWFIKLENVQKPRTYACMCELIQASLHVCSHLVGDDQIHQFHQFHHHVVDRITQLSNIQYTLLCMV